jgi:anti-sigma B factor antagonist
MTMAAHRVRPAVNIFAPPMTVTVHRLDAATVVTVHGDVDLLTAPRLHETMIVLLWSEPPVIVIDLLATTFFGVSGLAVLTDAHHLTGHRTQLRLAVTGQLGRQLRLSGVDREIPAYPTRAEALAGTVDSG